MFCSKISKLGGMVELCQNRCPKQPPYYEVMIYSNAVVPCDGLRGQMLLWKFSFLKYLQKRTV